MSVGRDRRESGGRNEECNSHDAHISNMVWTCRGGGGWWWWWWSLYQVSLVIEKTWVQSLSCPPVSPIQPGQERTSSHWSSELTAVKHESVTLQSTAGTAHTPTVFKQSLKSQIVHLILPPICSWFSGNVWVNECIHRNSLFSHPQFWHHSLTSCAKTFLGCQHVYDFLRLSSGYNGFIQKAIKQIQMQMILKLKIPILF